MKNIFLISVVMLFVCTALKAQTPEEINQQNIYSIYEEQYKNLLQTRGLPDDEITNLLKTYAANKLGSDSAFAKLLGQFYSKKKNIGILFYFFNNDTLRRAYYKPGEIVEIKKIPIKKAKLMQLGADINQSLNLYKLSNNRTPVSRGNITINKKEPKSISFNDAVKNATDILIPLKFDQNSKHLLIIPALNIGTIPFHLLQPFGNKSFLIDSCSFTIIPSLIDLVALRTKILKKQNKFWSADKLPESFDNDPDFYEQDKFNFILENPLLISNPSYPIDSSFIFPNLPGAEKEIEATLQFVTNKYTFLKGKQATKDSVLKYIFEADVAYFATHGIADQEDPMGKSFLVLSGKSPYLTAKEIMAMRKTNPNLPEMIILSACQTGLGKSLEAGTAGLARSFLLGGSNHVIMSLWSVDDDATAYLMSRFIYHLQTPHRFMPAEPLRLAVLDTKKIFKNPAQWASFSLFGIDY
ncbi:MAG TPA: CHAT domain-containing protein [Ferruginibacter sp.]|nr:CHAT domain-containing protein [Ferruginibacter sp.]